MTKSVVIKNSTKSGKKLMAVFTKDKNLDHDHNIDGYNVRCILCTRCNHSCNEIE